MFPCNDHCCSIQSNMRIATILLFIMLHHTIVAQDPTVIGRFGLLRSLDTPLNHNSSYDGIISWEELDFSGHIGISVELWLPNSNKLGKFLKINVHQNLPGWLRMQEGKYLPVSDYLLVTDKYIKQEYRYALSNDILLGFGVLKTWSNDTYKLYAGLDFVAGIRRQFHQRGTLTYPLDELKSGRVPLSAFYFPDEIIRGQWYQTITGTSGKIGVQVQIVSKNYIYFQCSPQLSYFHKPFGLRAWGLERVELPNSNWVFGGNLIEIGFAKSFGSKKSELNRN